MIYKLVFKNDEISENELILCEINKDELGKPVIGVVMIQYVDKLNNIKSNIIYYVNIDDDFTRKKNPDLIDIITKQNRITKINELYEDL
jgi:hypothetical protein